MCVARATVLSVQIMAEGLLWAVKNGDEGEIKKHFTKSGFDVNAELMNGRNALHYAADYGQVDVVNLLLEQKANIDAPDKFGITPLLAAIYEGHTEVVKLLIQKGANKSGKSPEGLSYADCAETDDVKALLQ